EEEIIDDDIFKDDDGVVIVETMQPEEDVVLSQKFSQLSTHTEDEQKSDATLKRRRSSVASSSPDVHLKKTKTIIDDDNELGDDTTVEPNQIPMYLLMTDRWFLHMAQTITKAISSIHIHDITTISYINASNSDVQGTLKEPNYTPIEIYRSVWPMQVQSLMLTQHKSTTSMEIHTE
ncbi:unnamed protein product, partial [Rotaria magnacalcarata]